MTQYWITTDPEVLGTSLQAETPEQAVALAFTAHKLTGEHATVRWNLKVRDGEPTSAYWMCSSTEVPLPKVAAPTHTPAPAPAPSPQGLPRPTA